MVALLDLADRQGIALGIASSSPTIWVEPLLDQLGLRQRFRTVVCREHAALAKPAPDLYLEAARRLGVQPRGCAAFEDSHNGSLAAVAAGMTTVAVPNDVTESQDFGHVDLLLRSLVQVDLTSLESIASHKAVCARRSAWARRRAGDTRSRARRRTGAGTSLRIRRTVSRGGASAHDRCTRRPTRDPPAGDSTGARSMVAARTGVGFAALSTCKGR